MEHQHGAAPILPAGTRCDQFQLERMLSVGGFGQVFEARLISGYGDKSVVKVEAQSAMFQLLFNECACLKSLNKAFNPENRPDASPFLVYYGYGQIDGFRWLAMQKCGKNLNDLRAQEPLKKFSIPTSLYILSKFIESLHQMHSIGWLHRDVKPANMCISLQNPRHLYILDFGMSRIYVEKDGTLKPRRVSAPFRGTLRYVSVNIHRRQDASRWDDLWSAFYIATENIVGFLPWRRMGDAKLVEEKKQTFDLSRLKYGQEYARPNSLNVLENYLSTSQTDPSFFYQAPPYDVFQADIATDLRLRGFPNLLSVPLDWMTIRHPPTHQYHLINGNAYHRRPATPRTPKTPRYRENQQRNDRSVCFY